MTDDEFVAELATRLNLFLQSDDQRSQAVLTTPLMHAGFASVGHFLGQICCPRGITDQSPPEQLENVKFLMPHIDKGRIVRFECVTGAELQERVKEAAQEAESEGPDGTKIH
jgi:hypothetical protein